MKKILNVPYYSQHRDVKDGYWRLRACGILCLKSILDFHLDPGVPSGVDEFVEMADRKGAYGKSGWIHQGLIDIAGEFGLEMERKEYKSDDLKKSEMLLENGINRIVDSIKNNKPVLISAIKRWKEKDKFHMIVLTGFENDEKGNLKGFYYNDTDYDDEEGGGLFVDIKTFKKYWRRLAIFVK